jgi:hypothetical protein
MIMPVEGKLTANFTEPRPLSNPGEHIHGAVDISAPVGTPIRAPESGTLFGYIGIRYKEGQYWPAAITLHNKIFPFLNYFYDMYGGILVLQAHNGNIREIERTHVIAHSYANQILNKSIFREFPQHWIEQDRDDRFPVHAVYTDPIVICEGDIIGYLGNAGYSTGAHIHHEIHRGYKWNKHENRINPERYF